MRISDWSSDVCSSDLQNSAGKLRAEQDAARAVLSQRVHDAAAQIGDNAPVVLLTSFANPAMPDRVAVLRDVVLPHVRGEARHIELLLSGDRMRAEYGKSVKVREDIRWWRIL